MNPKVAEKIGKILENVITDADLHIAHYLISGIFVSEDDSEKSFQKVLDHMTVHGKQRAKKYYRDVIGGVFR